MKTAFLEGPFPADELGDKAIGANKPSSNNVTSPATPLSPWGKNDPATWIPYGWIPCDESDWK
eukprot:8766079-Pyramimonas_sp.AAC.1